MSKTRKPLIIQEFNNYDHGRGWVIIDPVTQREVAHLTAGFRAFMEAWMEAPLGEFEVRTWEDEHE